jgi:signal peptide peptidase SppA
MTTTALAGQIYAMERTALDAILSGAIRAVVRESRPGVRAPAGTAVVGIYGPMEYRPGLLALLFGYGTSTLELAATFRRLAADSEVKQILMEIDSPGGSIEGVSEAAAAIRAARKVKPVYAVASPMAASAAFWLAAQATRLLVMGSGQVGSIGVYGVHEDISKAAERIGVKTTLISAGKYKTEGNPFEPLSDPARADMQSKVDAHYRQFTDDVAFGRGVSPSAVVKGYGEGRMLLARDAVRAGMVDGIGGLDDALQGIAIERGRFIAEMDRRRRIAASRLG